VVVGGSVVVVVVLDVETACDAGVDRVANTAIATPAPTAATASAITKTRRDLPLRDSINLSAPVSGKGALQSS
jgi:hypothetical protein